MASWAKDVGWGDGEGVVGACAEAGATGSGVEGASQSAIGASASTTGVVGAGAGDVVTVGATTGAVGSALGAALGAAAGAAGSTSTGVTFWVFCPSVDAAYCLKMVLNSPSKVGEDVFTID